jgi:hypothetical protein
MISPLRRRSFFDAALVVVSRGLNAVRQIIGIFRLVTILQLAGQHIRLVCGVAVPTASTMNPARSREHKRETQTASNKNFAHTPPIPVPLLAEWEAVGG